MADETDDTSGNDGGASIGRSDANRGIDVLALAVAGLGLVLAGGVGGAVVAALVAAVWYALPPEYAFATGQAGLLAVSDGGATYALAAAALGGLLLATLWATAPSVRFAVGGALLGAVLGGGAWYVAADGTPVWIVAAALAGTVALGSYGLHRYELVAVGLAGGERA